MKTVLPFILFLSLILCVQQAEAQTWKGIKFNSVMNLTVKKLEAQKKMVRAEEKEKLKDDVKKIKKALKENRITQEQAEEEKKEAAEKRAKNIENQLDIIDANIALLKRNKEDKNSKFYQNLEYLTVKTDTTKTAKKPHKTHSGLTLAFGLNNAIGDGQSLDDSPYKIGGSRFFEIGYEFRTVLIKSGFLRLNYGINFQFNGLKPTEDRYFVRDDGQIKLKDFPYDLKKAKLRMDNLVIPIHFEIGPANSHYVADKFKLGLGGYAGVNLRTIQKLKYKENGHRNKDRISNKYDTNNFIYGLSAYIGYDWISFYIKYDLNPIFKDNSIDEYNVAAGLRLIF